MKAYYRRRADEYDATSYEAQTLESGVVVRELMAAVSALPAGKVVDLACGTGYLTQCLNGEVVAVDQSQEMLDIARTKAPGATLLCADIPPIPLSDDSFELAFSSHFYSHLESDETRRLFVSEALRVASALVIVEQAWQPGLPTETWEDRPLSDGSVWSVFKRYFTPESLAKELKGELVFASSAFVMVRVSRHALGDTSTNL